MDIVIIPLRFIYSDVIIDISFLAIEEYVPTLSSIEDMLDSRLDAFLRKKYVRV